MGLNTLLTRALVFVFVMAAIVNVSSNFTPPACAQDMAGQQGAQRDDPRKHTTIQTAAADIGNTKEAVKVRYLDLPFGEKTFGYMSVGGDDYYSNRRWPIAHLTLAKAAVADGKTLPPGDYVVVITPKSATSGMTLSLASFKPATPGGTFLVPGDVFTEVPKDAVDVVSKEVSFSDNETPNTHLEVWVGKTQSGVDIKLHYGGHGYTESLAVK